MFHTLFNIINTSVFLPFVPQLAFLASKLVWTKEKESSAVLKYLEPHLVDSPPMALHAARQEILRMINEVESMLGRVLMLISSPEKKMSKVADAISSSEQVVDYLEKEIIEYLASVSRMEVSIEQSHEIAGYIGAVSDIERIGDHCESLHKLLVRRYDKKLKLSEDTIKNLVKIGDKVHAFINLIRDNLKESEQSIMVKARDFENSINEMRKKMRKEYIQGLNQGTCDVSSGIMTIDMLTSFEKMGDHAYNVAQMLAGER
jgi:phosphate:Na+ symporter